MERDLRGSDRSKKIHLVSAWDCLRSLLLGQVKTAEKSNEITAIPELIEGLDLTGAIVTIDAAGCQKEIVRRILEKGGDYVIALKGNQGNLLAEAENFFQQAACVGYEEAGCEVSSSIEKSHGRLEERTIVVINQLDWLDSRTDWAGLTSMIEVTSRRTIKDKTTEEKRYFISSRSLSAKNAGTAVRNHWLIENHLHWSMDVNFYEDACLASVGHAAENFAIFRRLAATLFRIRLGGIRGTAGLRRQAKWNEDVMLSVLSEVFSVANV
jgi:predicted transposase YbfD/YdcC